ncbi:Fic family protein [Paramicrobacterium humi]|uniref:Fic family protein n=1 Tax=Paramicrobacterium humi TaxID=640635 RepID=A0A1H4KB12_9MICO|nr:Fic family protein [Microbacterium humi]SEB55729.1 Fic family protein [Microbacterium humi]
MTTGNEERERGKLAPGWPEISYEPYPWVRTGDEVASRRALLQARGDYSAAVPALIADAQVALSAEAIALADDASQELARFDAEAGTVTAPFASILLRTESASSSEVENLTSSAKQVALAEIGESRSDNARLVVANVNAMKAAIALSDRLDDTSILAMHDALLRDTAPQYVGHWREEQVWIGGGGISPHAATFVPPHHTRVPGLIADMLAFAGRTDVPVLIQAAIAHAQFETIHPFPDGNGRTGRALLQGMLHHGRLTRNVTVPVSAGLLHDLDAYFSALTEYRAGRPEAIVTAVAEASFAAIQHSRALVTDIRATAKRWDSQVVARSDSSVHRLKAYLLRQPVVNTRTVAAELEISEVAAQNAIDKLVDATVLTQTSTARRNRTWQAPEILAALDAFGARARRGRG